MRRKKSENLGVSFDTFFINTLTVIELTNSEKKEVKKKYFQKNASKNRKRYQLAVN